MRVLGGLLAGAGAIIMAIGAGIAPATAGGESDGFQYVSLGDSYSAGFGIEPFLQDSPVPATVTEGGVLLNGCYQAGANYPHQVASLLGFALDDQTCSGAVTANLTTTPQLSMVGQQLPAVQNAALSADTDVVTLTIGGNDLLFSTIAEYCIRLDVNDPPDALLLYSPTVSSCEQFYTAPAGFYTWNDSGTIYSNINIADQLTDIVVPRLHATYAAIKQAAPNAQVFVIGYPQIAAPTSTLAQNCYSLNSGTNPVNAVPFAPSDIVWLSTVESSLVTQIETLTAAQGGSFHYVDGWTPSAGHDLCAPSNGGTSWITAMSGQIDIFGGLDCDMSTQQPIVHNGDTVGCLDLGALHPNALGVASLASATSAGIASGFAPGLHLAAGDDPQAGGEITIAGFGFPASAPVQLSFHSDPVPLGSVTTTTLGTFVATVTIPAGAVGPHSIVATSGAVSYSVALALPLPDTGFDPLLPILLGLCLVTAGFLLVVTRRRSLA